MAVAREDGRNAESVSVDGSTLEEVYNSITLYTYNFKYLGAKTQSDGDVSKEIKSRLAMGLKALNGMKKLWQGQDKETKLRVLRACIFPMETYDCEAWVLRKTDEKKITAFENKCYRKIPAK